MTDTYLTINEPSEGLYKEKASKFIAYAFPVTSVEQCQAHIQEIKRMHFKARHHCFAYEIGFDGQEYRASDDGEPSGTAGKPILGQIRSAQLKNILIVVVRYFGGTKLGVSGLIHAYKSGAKDAIDQAQIINSVRQSYFAITFGYDLMPQIMSALKSRDITISSKSFEDKGIIYFSTPYSLSDNICRRLMADIEQKPLELITEDHKTFGYEIKLLRSD